MFFYIFRHQAKPCFVDIFQLWSNYFCTLYCFQQLSLLVYSWLRNSNEHSWKLSKQQFTIIYWRFIDLYCMNFHLHIWQEISVQFHCYLVKQKYIFVSCFQFVFILLFSAFTLYWGGSYDNITIIIIQVNVSPVQSVHYETSLLFIKKKRKIKNDVYFSVIDLFISFRET